MATPHFRFVSVNEAAEQLGLTVGRIRQLLLAEELPGVKVNEKAWAIAQKDLDRFKKNREKAVDQANG